MNALEAINQLRSDVDDKGDQNSFFSDLELAQFLSRAITFTQGLTEYAEREEYIVLTVRQQAYSLPLDFVKVNRIYDPADHRNLATTPLSNLEQFSLGRPTAYNIDKKRKKIIFDNVPDPTVYVKNDYRLFVPSNFMASADTSYVYLFRSYQAGVDYFITSPILQIVNSVAGSTEYFRIAAVEDETYTVGGIDYTVRKVWLSERDLKGTYSTAPWSSAPANASVTLSVDCTSGSAILTPTVSGQESNVVVGDFILFGSQSGFVKSIDTTAHEIELYDACTATLSAQAVTRYVLKAKLVDYVMEYAYMPDSLWWRSVGTSAATTGKLVVSSYNAGTKNVVLKDSAGTAFLDSKAIAGDMLFIPRSTRGLLDDGETQLIQAVGANGAAGYTMELAYATAPTAGQEVWFVGTSWELPFPLELHQFVVWIASIWAFKRMGDDGGAQRAYESATELMGRFQSRQMAEEAEHYNNRSLSQSSAQLDMNPWKRFALPDLGSIMEPLGRF